MKTIIKSIFATLLVIAAVSCTEKYPLYDYPENRLGFLYTYDETVQQVLDSTTRFTFVYKPSDVQQDTVWVTLQTSGFTSSEDRVFELRQLEANATNIHTSLEEGAEVVNAEPGTHFLPFDDPALKKHLIVKAGATTATVPVVLYRHPDLQTKKIYLRFALKENEHFKESFHRNRYMVIEMSDMISMPKEWGMGHIQHYFAGPYSVAKHRFMIDYATWTLDDKWFSNHFSTWTVDMGYTGYLSTFFTRKLIEVNDKRLAEGLDVIRDEEGNPIYFVNNSTPQPYKTEK